MFRSNLKIASLIESSITGIGTAQEIAHSGPADVANPPIYSDCINFMSAIIIRFGDCDELRVPNPVT